MKHDKRPPSPPTAEPAREAGGEARGGQSMSTGYLEHYERQLTGAAAPIQRRIGDGAATHDAAGAGASFDAAVSGGGGPVPFRQDMERAFGQDFSGVEAHLGKGAEMASIGALAATRGERIAFASTRPDRETVAHELT